MTARGYTGPKARDGIYGFSQKVEADHPPYSEHPHLKRGGPPTLNTKRHPIDHPKTLPPTTCSVSSSGVSSPRKAPHVPPISTEKGHPFQKFTDSSTDPSARGGSHYSTSPVSAFPQPIRPSPPHTSYPPIQYPSEIKFHRHLGFRRTSAPAEPRLVWDIIHHPQVSKVVTERNIIIEPEFKALAMEPAVKRFEVWTDHAILASYMHGWGPIVVQKSNPTVETILDAIYAYLQTALSKNDLQMIGSNAGGAKHLERARKERAQDGFELCEVAIKGPFRRSDVVGGHRRFLGFRAVKLEDGSHRLYFNLGPGPVPRY